MFLLFRLLGLPCLFHTLVCFFDKFGSFRHIRVQIKPKSVLFASAHSTIKHPLNTQNRPTRILSGVCRFNHYLIVSLNADHVLTSKVMVCFREAIIESHGFSFSDQPDLRFRLSRHPPFRLRRMADARCCSDQVIKVKDVPTSKLSAALFAASLAPLYSSSAFFSFVMMLDITASVLEMFLYRLS